MLFLIDPCWFYLIQTDRFTLAAVDLGKLYKVKVRHDNSMLNPSWFLDRIEVDDMMDDEHYVFHCERWLAKNKEDSKIERVLYVKVLYLTTFQDHLDVCLEHIVCLFVYIHIE